MASSNTSVTEKAAGRVLLPNHVVPIRYDMEITPDLDAFVFQGTIVIEMKVDPSKFKDNEKLSKEITLHSKDLCFASAEYLVVGSTSSTPVVADEILMNIKATTVTFVFGQSLPVTDENNIALKIRYSGFLNNEMCGFYRSSYTDASGQKQFMASTQFESIDARRAFPCVDEPAAKAVFGITFIVPTKYNVVSNMPEKLTHTMSPSKKKITFLDTPIMSTYLVAFCVGEFDAVQGMTSNGVLVRVLTPPQKAHLGVYALDVAIRCLDLYDTFFGTPFPLPKLDMIAISEFAMGAMENWGLVTYREVELLVDPSTASSKQKQRVAVVVAHELAHQWFGNLVTMQWWDDLWLNEGFASWTENYAVDALFPDYKMWDQFTTDHFSSALRLDALKSSHPIQVPINHAEEVEQVFDGISYYKGACVVRMIKAILGMKFFQQGLSNYMKKYAYSNTETVDLWSAWEQVSQMPILNMMASWTEQMGFPLVKVVKEEWHDDKAVFDLEQNWFLSDGSEPDDEGKTKLWTIPLLTQTDEGLQSDMTLMREKTVTVTIPLANKKSWVKFNAHHEVPMRFLGTPQMSERIAVAIQSKQLHQIDRAGLLNDAFAIVKAGHQTPESLIHLMRNYIDEDQFVVWEALSNALLGMEKVLSDDVSMLTNFTTFVKPLVKSLLNKVGWQATETESHMTTLLRSSAVDLICKFAYDDADVVAESRKRFAAFLKNNDDVESLPFDIRGQIFRIVLKNGNEVEFNEIKDYYTKAKSNVEQKLVLVSLGHIPDSKLKLATLEWSISGEVKLQDFFYLMGSVGGSGDGGNLVCWKFFQDNFARINNFIGAGASSSITDAVIVMCAGNFSSNEKADEISAFFEANPLPRNSRKIAQMLENMRANASFFDMVKSSALSKSNFWESLNNTQN